MVEYYNNKLCIHARWLWEDGEIMSKPNYKKCVREGKMRVVRRGCKNTPALVDYESMFDYIKDAIKSKVGNVYRLVVKNNVEINMRDVPEAEKFYRDYTFGDGRHLPEDTQREYCLNVKVMNSVGVVFSETKAFRNARNKHSVVDVWENISESVNDLKLMVDKYTQEKKYPHTLPENARRLRQRYDAYKKEGYAVFIHRNFCNKHTEKLSNEGKMWILAQWANNVDRITSEEEMLNVYNDYAEAMRGDIRNMKKWPEVKSVGTIHNFLFSDGIKQLWWGNRYGELNAKEKFMYQHSTLLPCMRDSLWYSDGTKVNLMYRDENGKPATINVYEVLDVYSETFIGYAFGSECSENHRLAYRRALEYSGQIPYEIRFDNQGGHNKLYNTGFFNKLSRLVIKTKPYNGKSKTIENVFGRFQAQLQKKRWYFTGQNITAKRTESKANWEVIHANHENLPTLDEVMNEYLSLRSEWNNGKHPKTQKVRREMYRNSANPATIKINEYDIIDLFCEKRAEKATLTAYGILIQENNVKYNYSIYTEDGLPDVRWIAEHVDNRYVIKYDQNDMSKIYLFDETPRGLVYINTAIEKLKVHRGKQEAEEWEAEFIANVDKRIKALRLENRDEMDKILAEHNLLPEQHGLNTPLLPGLETSRSARRRTDVIMKKSNRARIKGIAGMQKELSEATIAEQFDVVDAMLDKINDEYPVVTEKTIRQKLYRKI